MNGYPRKPIRITDGKTHLGLNEIARSMGDKGTFQSHWRFLIVERYLAQIAQAKDGVLELNAILAVEKDRLIRELLLFQSGRASVIGDSIDYALWCHGSRGEDPIARIISAMVVAKRTRHETAEELGLNRHQVAAYERLFFDIRRYLDLPFRIAPICYFPELYTTLDAGAARWLITAFRRGSAGLAFTFSQPDWDSSSKQGKRIHDQIRLSVFARVTDFISWIDINGTPPTAEEFEHWQRVINLYQSLSEDLSSLDYPPTYGPKERKELREINTRYLDQMSAEARRRVTTILDKLLYTDPPG